MTLTTSGTFSATVIQNSLANAIGVDKTWITIYDFVVIGKRAKIQYRVDFYILPPVAIQSQIDSGLLFILENLTCPASVRSDNLQVTLSNDTTIAVFKNIIGVNSIDVMDHPH